MFFSFVLHLGIFYFTLWRLLVRGRCHKLEDGGPTSDLAWVLAYCDWASLDLWLLFGLWVLLKGAEDRNLLPFPICRDRLGARLQEMKRLAVLSGRGNVEISRFKYLITYCDKYGIDLSYSSQNWDILMDSLSIASPSEVIRCLSAWCITYSK